jgi:predicted nucleotidyltransferase
MNTTIAISKAIRDQIKEYGNKGETYDEIIAKLLKSAKERQIQDLLMDTTNDILVKEALNKAKKKWQ